uniref:Transthyretin-like family protein n=1 Tax=Wuchereria bancrofti TaxID=6293 RepID=A0A1I8E952_WUCBA
MLQLLLLFFVLANFQLLESRMQSVKIRGIFQCGSEIPRNATIELWDEDQPLLNFVHQFIIQKNSNDPDDKLFTTHPNIDGSFEISATHEEFTKLSLYMVVYHQCEHLIHYKYNQLKDREVRYYLIF